MEQAYALVNYSGQSKYYSNLTLQDNKDIYAARFIKVLKNGSLEDTLRVGFIDMQNRIVNSSRCISLLHQLQQHINAYLNIKETAKESINMKNSNCYLHIFFIYLYFVCPDDKLSTYLFRQQILDTMLVYSIDKEFTRWSSYMIDFVLCAVISERQLRDGIEKLVCSQYDELDSMIKLHHESRVVMVKEFRETGIQKEYISWFLDCFSEAKDFISALEIACNNSET